MEELTKRLNAVEDSYYGFVAGVVTYAKKKQARKDAVNDYLDNHPNALTSEILDFISKQDDFYEDASYVKQIS